MNSIELAKHKRQQEYAQFMETGKATFSLRRHFEQQALEEQALTNTFKAAVGNHELLQNVYEQVDKDLNRYSAKKQVLNDVSTYLSERVCPDYPEYTKLAFKLATAREKGCLGRNPDGKLVCAWDNKANSSLLCPFDSNTETKRLIDRYLPPVTSYLKRWNTRIYYVVLSCPHFEQGDLEKGKRLMFKNFANLLRKAPMSMVQGALARQEDPLSVGRKWNVHLNAFLLTHGDMPPALIRKQWSDYYGQDVQVYVKRINGNLNQMQDAFLEAFKYSAQLVPNKSIAKSKNRNSCAPAFVDYEPQEAHEWLSANKGFRRTRSYGLLYKIPPRATDEAIGQQTEWIGVIRYKTNGYEINYCAGFRGDLIQANNSTNHQSNSEHYPPAPPNYLTNELCH
ncbi:MAG: hypothetical protein HWD86_04780 [Kangiellaceae bacterium]|nr:hypothetical protein [Kangiellaceae bacterium]